jgi:hypothetical protein
LQTEFKEVFYKKKCRCIEAKSCQLKYTESWENFDTTCYSITREPNRIEASILTSLKFYGSYTFILCTLHFKIIKIVTVGMGPFRFLLSLPLYGFCIDMPEDGLSTSENM